MGNVRDSDKEDGAGNRKASEKYRKAQHEFAEDGKQVKKKAREAADAVDGEEGTELERAERVTKDGHANADKAAME